MLICSLRVLGLHFKVFKFENKSFYKIVKCLVTFQNTFLKNKIKKVTHFKENTPTQVFEEIGF